MQEAEELFLEFGGHAGAGGFSTDLEKLITLEEKLSEAYKVLTLKNDSKDQTLENSYISLSLREVGEKLWKTLSQFAPFGMDNPKPVFNIKTRIKSVRQFGKENNHLEFVFSEGSKEVKGISFFSSPSSYSVLPTPNSFYTVRVHLENSYFRNRSEIRLRIIDILEE